MSFLRRIKEENLGDKADGRGTRDSEKETDTDTQRKGVVGREREGWGRDSSLKYSLECGETGT